MANDNIGDRLTMVETSVAYLVARQSEVEKLAEATERLSQSTLAVEEALRTVGEIRFAQRQTSDAVQSISPRLEKIEHRLPRRGRFALLVICVVLLAVVVFLGGRDRLHLGHRVDRLCQATHSC